MNNNEFIPDALDEEFIPNKNLTICKYMDFLKFMSLFHYEKLYFSRADRFQDKMEGKIPEAFFNNFSTTEKIAYEKIHKSYKEHKTKTYISCWSEFHEESYAMWQIYSKTYGLAIQTTVEKLEKALISSHAIIRKVKYIDYNSKDEMIEVPMAPSDGTDNLRRNFFVIKPKFYEYEKEIRAIIVSKEEELYQEIPIDLNFLIDEIIISPFASRWAADLIKDLVWNRFGFKNISIFDSGVEVRRYK